ncbi:MULTISPECIES: AraC family transcriptional regulator [unclassified Butyrivibrio]|uniref:AraC family transcriptional regulator n=1 Tax=unclassified Butyrivibrio TaxID=2639466 RepID=UPI0008E36EF0|nr:MULTISPECIES: AraC family transcriptional regulator [unclassified Butyrivibrio]RKM62683.1 AraC family transcriptional regulator [Butyrivibrio sp. XB500-5]SFU46329.1 AraC-like ligand binding domain-containing protein [Butyrivibrio sp. INlla21]
MNIKDNLKEYEQKGYLNKDFRFFHISDKEELDIPYHYHDFHKLILILDGNVKYMIEGREYELLPFDFVLVNRFYIHRPVVSSDGGTYDRIILYLSHSFLESNGLLDAFNISAEKDSHVARFSANISAELLDMLKLIEDDMAKESSEYAGELTTRLDVLKMLIAFNKACISEERAFGAEARYNRRVIELIEYITDNLGSDLSIDLLADKFYMSRYHMMRTFKKETGYSIHRYISEKRILKARDLIISGMPTTAACIESGFKDYSSFSRAFKNQLGILPSDVKI